MNRMGATTTLSHVNRIPMLKVFVADPYYATDAMPSYVCVIDINTCLTEYGEINLLDKTELGFVHRMNKAFARGLDISLICLVDSNTRAYIVNHAFFSDDKYPYITTNAAILNGIYNVARAINAKTNLYYNKLSFDVDQVGWAGESPFNLEYRVEWVDFL